MILSDMGMTLGRMGDQQGRYDMYTLAVDLLSNAGDRSSEASATTGRGEALHALGRHEEALVQHYRAEAIFRELGLAQRDLIDVLCNLGETLDILGRPAEALRSRVEAADLAASGVHLEQYVRAKLVTTGRRP